MVTNALPISAANTLPAAPNPPGKLPGKNAAANSPFKSIYLSLPILESTPTGKDALSSGTNPSPVPVKKAARTNPDGSMVTVPVLPVPAPIPAPAPASRALTVALLSQPEAEQASSHTTEASIAKTPAQSATEPGPAVRYKADSSTQPRPSLGEQLSLPSAVQQPKSISKPAEVAEWLSKEAPVNAQPSEDPQAPQVSSPERGALPIHQSQPEQTFPTPAVEGSQKDSSPRRTRNQDVPVSVALPVAQPPERSAPRSDASSLPPAGQSPSNAKTDDPSSTVPATTKSQSLAQAENLAFSLHLQSQTSPAVREQAAPQSAKAHAVAPETKREESPAAPPAERNALKDAPESTLRAEVANVATNLAPSEGLKAAPGTRAAAWMSQSPEAPHVPAAVAVHEAQPISSDSPKLNMTGQILLHLQGNDQSSAAVRLVDRAGALNVSVHATDTELRNTLRSNVGELVSQLNGQGWKAEVDKPAITSVRAQTPQDPQSNGQRSPNQHQSSSDGDRQPPRDRRSNSGRWLEELQQQTSGPSSNPGGKN